MDDEQVIFQWTSKLLYGTMFKELSLLYDRSNPLKGNILPVEFVESYEAMHLFLQSIRIPTEFVDPKPWSIFVFNYKGHDFDYMNDISALGVSLKFGEIGVSIVFQDNNCVELFLKKLKYLQSFSLNHVQFLEVSARIFYGKHLAENTPKYFHIFNMEDKVLRVNTLNNLTLREWNDEEFAFYLEQIIRRNKIDIGLPIMDENKSFTTYLVDQDGIKFIDKINKLLSERSV
ncbi:hypothetical protein [Pontibacter vulgaris]|uniref:hypothetical protein n=1 Tax=Pontibacter vulgaris TaxID=2905679 RepID=UPI001FA6E395|nr:hypothetical protein [Pontibacter vulgaris]